MVKKSLIAITLASILSLAACSALENMGKVPQNYTQTNLQRISNQAIIEKKYAGLGQYTVANQTFSAGKNNRFTQKIWYPQSLSQNLEQNKTYPLVIMANGSGSTFGNYEAVFAHLASWGFVVIGNDNKSSWSGASSEESLNFAITLNNSPNSPLYHKIDTHKAGIAGPSQGGVAIINAVTRFPNSYRYKAVFGASTTKHDLAEGLKWDYDISKIKVPYFAVAGTGIFDAGKPGETNGGITPLISMNTNFSKISPNVPQVMARLKNSDHGDMISKPDGYMTAWFSYWLKGDTQAKKAFFGNNAEIITNPSWQDVKVKN